MNHLYIYMYLYVVTKYTARANGQAKIHKRTKNILYTQYDILAHMHVPRETDLYLIVSFDNINYGICKM